MGAIDLRHRVRAEVKAKREKRPLLDLRHESEDLPKTARDLSPFLAKVEQGGDDAPPKAQGSPFSLESLITAELAPPAPPPGKVPLIWELRRNPSAVTKDDGDLFGGLTQGMARALYQRAQAYLIWTEGEVMGGQDADLKAARRFLGAIPPQRLEEEEGGPHGPMLPDDVALIRGELTLEAYQVYEAHILGADAFTLFPVLLSQGQLEEVVGFGKEAGLMPIALVWREEDALRAKAAGVESLLYSPRDPLSSLPIKSRACIAGFQALGETLGGFSMRLAYAPLAKAPRLIELGEIGATGLVSCARGDALLKDLRTPS